ncbi:MAG: cGAMP-activated phospholipase [Chthoniobacter sp.]|jgi:patatin-like phospholipase/acyl hydrolase|nr:cGAMP-activated phospholipase [Chthoniobacter sp.]
MPDSPEAPPGGVYRILSLDGGGAKGFYTLGVLREIEGMIECRLHEKFDLVFGTSTGAIIAALIALGHSVKEISALYETHVPRITARKKPAERSKVLHQVAKEVFADVKFDAVKTAVGIVTTKWVIERPMIFKGSIAQAHGRKGTFAPGFGCTIADAVEASCSAFPFFLRKMVVTEAGDHIELIDGGYCANNPTLYAIADAIMAIKQPQDSLRVVSVGVGVYPEPKPRFPSKMWLAKYLLGVQLLQKTLEINTQSMDQLQTILFKQIRTIRINDKFEKPEMATDLFEHDLHKLNILRQRGSESFASREPALRDFLL